MANKQPTEGELEILRVLWQAGPSTVRFINDTLNERKAVGYTTTLKLMQIMHEKGFLSRTKVGKTHIYKAELNQQATQETLVDRLTNLAFGGSTSSLVMRALGNSQPSREELDEIRRLLDELESDQDA